MSRARFAIALVLVGILSISTGCLLIAVPLGLIVLGALLTTGGLLLDVGRRP